MSYLLIGFGKSNQAIAQYLISNEHQFDLFLDQEIELPFPLSETTKIFYQLSSIDPDVYHSFLKSPGIPHSHPIFKLADDYDIPIINEISFALPFVDQLLIGITGTNGKTTVTSLVEHILSRKKAVAVGNIGRSFLNEAIHSNRPLIAELSSFQLKDLSHFSPDISVFLNFQSSHLDYHPSLKDYFDSKSNIVSYQDVEKPFIFNLDDPAVSSLAHKRRGNLRSFSLIDSNATAYFNGEDIFVAGEKWLTKKDVLLFGNHNFQNILASILICLELEERDFIIEQLKTFTGVEHRLETVLLPNSLLAYNDSKSTNPAASYSALKAFDQNVVLMIGGLNRKSDFSSLVDFKNKLTHVSFFGEIGPSLYTEFQEVLPCSVHSTFEEAVSHSFEKSDSFTPVLFSPGCASWDQFSNFEERGNLFKSISFDLNPISNLLQK